MNILILSLYAPTGTNFREGIGGSQEVLYQLGKRWIGSGNKVKIISAYKDKKIPKFENLDGIEIERVGGFYSAIFSIKDAYYEKEKWADIVIENYTSYPLYASLYVKKPLITVMHHLMGIGYIDAIGLIKGGIGYLTEKTISYFYKNTKFIAVSEFSKDQLLNLEIESLNVKVISNGININYFIQGEKAHFPLIFFVGNFMDGRKKVDDLISAFQKIAARITDAKLVIAGNGGNKEKILKNTIKGDNRINYIGLIDAKMKKELYQKAWVFVNPSIAEGFSLSCLEANACGTPAIVYDLKGLETVQHGINGLVVEQKNANELADAIVSLLINRELRNEMSLKARKFAERYNWDTSAEMYLTEFENVLSVCRKI